MTEPGRVGQLDVRYSEFRRALRILERVVGTSKKKTVSLEFERGVLTIDCEGQSTGVDASGDWTGTTHLPLYLLLRLGRQIPESDPLRLTLGEGSLAIGKIRITSPRDEDLLSRAVASAASILAPLKVTAEDISQLVDTTRREGGSDATKPSEATQESGQMPWGKRPGQAAAELSRWGVTASDIENLIRAALQRWAR